MWIFLLAFLLLYGSLNGYFFLRACRALRPPAAARWILAFFLAVMTMGPVLVRLLERGGYPEAARLLGTVAHPWIAILFWFSFLALPADAWNLGVRLLGRFLLGPRRLLLPARPTFLAILVLVAVAALRGAQQAGRLTVREMEITTPLLPAGARPIRIVQLADFHLGLQRGKGLLRETLRRMPGLRPDVIVSTGDLLDSSTRYIADWAPELRALRAPLGQFAVLGNHEYYAGLRGSLAFHEAAGFRLLRQETVRLAPHVVLAGVDDTAGLRGGQPCRHDDAAALAGVPDEDFVILLKHQPRVNPAALGRLDLQLSGHTHGGQIFPFQFLVAPFYDYQRGIHRVGGNALLNVSRGIGTWGPPMRLLARPEICVITLRPASG